MGFPNIWDFQIDGISDIAKTFTLIRIRILKIFECIKAWRFSRVFGCIEISAKSIDSLGAKPYPDIYREYDFTDKIIADSTSIAAFPESATRGVL